MCLFNQSGGEEEKAPEPEPEREYTPAGRALKAKLYVLSSILLKSVNFNCNVVLTSGYNFPRVLQAIDKLVPIVWMSKH